MSDRNQWMASLVLLAVAAGCGGGDADVPAEPVPLTELGVQFVAAFCAEIYMCCPAANRAQNLDVGTDEATCRTLLARGGAALQAAMSEEVAGGRVTYDAGKMGECLRDFTARTCAAARSVHDPIVSLASCRAAIRGKVPAGAGCVLDDDCADGWCDPDAGFVCAPARATAQPCASDETCTSGQCDPTSNTCVTATPDGLCSL